MKRFTEMLLVDLPTGGRTAKYTSDLINKLGEYETIEEELGINLVTLFKAYKDGFYIKYEDGSRGFIHGGEYYLDIGFETKSFKMKSLPYDAEWYFKDYGKTWALTKEELKDE